ncbi:hypothetical protein CERSUDRAFT_78542 [Gelatoporia subvermispora B]|uniref:Uncharacterized protein n=1 Tax=Ceriporiopsis subvermispora (strain B) TaxID=914234 RepID=M2P6L2_CERS8|nr:hypothetical protein CERSUDRAFT_78542 [Gelatoporia subvermispora B]
MYFIFVHMRTNSVALLWNISQDKKAAEDDSDVSTRHVFEGSSSDSNETNGIVSSEHIEDLHSRSTEASDPAPNKGTAPRVDVSTTPKKGTIDTDEPPKEAWNIIAFASPTIRLTQERIEGGERCVCEVAFTQVQGSPYALLR